MPLTCSNLFSSTVVRLRSRARLLQSQQTARMVPPVVFA